MRVANNSKVHNRYYKTSLVSSCSCNTRFRAPQTTTLRSVEAMFCNILTANSNLALVSSRDSSVTVATGYCLGHRDSTPSRDKILFSIPPRLDRLWVPPRLLSNGCRVLLRRGKGAGTGSWPLTSI